jgi:hypothetical protein
MKKYLVFVSSICFCSSVTAQIIVGIAGVSGSTFSGGAYSCDGASCKRISASDDNQKKASLLDEKAQTNSKQQLGTSSPLK